MTVVEHWPGSAAFEVLAGQVIDGGCVSLTVTGNMQEPTFFELSVAVQVTVVVPFWKIVPDGGVQVAGTGPSQLSLAVTV